ncbi:MAG: 23S rRNA (adenine(2503)-C(2))-methyltransferase RlmN [Verrucomicrobia bacterium]|nr:23S rRNA (adenine(2503)-C(2))-methyltransferase RlmN [Verrucomicrobiota bacterium]
MAELLTISETDLKKYLSDIRQPSFRTAQILQWIYQKKASTWEEMTDLPKDLREQLASHFSLDSLKLVRTLDSDDGDTTKYLWKLPDDKLVESVLIRAPDRRTVCVSSQVGCPARCAFCASGKKGWIRNLTSSEIVEQVLQIDRLLHKIDERVCHIVFMGMGEPFENYEAVTEAIKILSDPKGLHISHRKITVSTVGIVNQIRRFADEGYKVPLVLSLHAPTQELRQKIIPYARKNPLPDLLMAMLYYHDKSGRDITYEYTLMAGLNDSIQHAKQLAALVKGHPCTVNLIPYNPVEGLILKRPIKEDIEAFRQVLEEARIPTTWRYTKGKDIAAACGQLALQTVS